jgi:hypothetical protein
MQFESSVPNKREKKTPNTTKQQTRTQYAGCRTCLIPASYWESINFSSLQLCAYALFLNDWGVRTFFGQTMHAARHKAQRQSELTAKEKSSSSNAPLTQEEKQMRAKKRCDVCSPGNRAGVRE